MTPHAPARLLFVLLAGLSLGGSLSAQTDPTALVAAIKR
jgi:hypothetical protein